MEPSDRLNDLLDLEKSAGWEWLREALKARASRHAAALAQPADTEDLTDVRFLQGQLTEDKWLFDGPSRMIQELRAKSVAASESAARKGE